jgi:hypothetical protein
MEKSGIAEAVSHEAWGLYWSTKAEGGALKEDKNTECSEAQVASGGSTLGEGDGRFG